MPYGKLTLREDIDRYQYLPEVAMSRVQLALNVNDIDEAVTFYTALFGTGPAKRRPATPTSPSTSRRSSWSCWRTLARAAP